MESYDFLLTKLNTFWEKDDATIVQLGAMKDHISRFLAWVIQTDWASPSNSSPRRDLASITPLQWYSLVDQFLYQHAPEKTEELKRLLPAALTIFEAEGKEALCLLTKTLIAVDMQCRGQRKEALELTTNIYELTFKEDCRVNINNNNNKNNNKNNNNNNSNNNNDDDDDDDGNNNNNNNDINNNDNNNSDTEDKDAVFVKAFVGFTHAFHIIRNDRKDFVKSIPITRRGLEDSGKYLRYDQSGMAHHFHYRFLVRDLRGRTVQAVRSRPPRPTDELDEEWRHLLERIQDRFGVHPFVAYALKERGNCLFDAGRHADCLDAYEAAADHLRKENDNLQMAKLLWLWGSTLGRLGMPGGKVKLDRALEMARGRDDVLAADIEKNRRQMEEGKLKSFSGFSGGKELCKWGYRCRNNKAGKCRFFHPN